MRNTTLHKFAAIAAAAAFSGAAFAADITGAGATFPYPDLRQVGRRLQEGDRRRD